MPRKKEMICITVHLPPAMNERLEELVRRGYYPSKSEAIRCAIRDLLKKHDDIERMRLLMTAL